MCITRHVHVCQPCWSPPPEPRRGQGVRYPSKHRDHDLPSHHHLTHQISDCPTIQREPRQLTDPRKLTPSTTARHDPPNRMDVIATDHHKQKNCWHVYKTDNQVAPCSELILYTCVKDSTAKLWSNSLINAVLCYRKPLTHFQLGMIIFVVSDLIVIGSHCRFVCTDVCLGSSLLHLDHNYTVFSRSKYTSYFVL